MCEIFEIGGRLCETTDALTDLMTRLQAEIDFTRIRGRWTPLSRHHCGDLCGSGCRTQRPVRAPGRGICGAWPLSRNCPWSSGAHLQAMNQTGPTPTRCTTWAKPSPPLSPRAATRSPGVRLMGTLEELRTQSIRGQIDASAADLRAAVIERNLSKYRGARRRASENRDLEAQQNRKLALLRRLQDVAPGTGASAHTDIW